MSRFMCRVCWNTAGWTRPTGEATRLERKSYVQTYGFGHEEWLFHYEWLLEGRKYAHLQPVSRHQRQLADQRIDLDLFTFGPGGQAFAVGTIDQVEVLDRGKAEDVLKEFQGRDWLENMASELRALRLDPVPLLNAPALETFNVGFEPIQAEVFDPPRLIPRDDPSFPTVNRYVLTTVARETSLVWKAIGSTSPTKSALSAFRRATMPTEVTLRHTRFQNAVHELLAGRGHRVLYERDRVDLMISQPEGNVLFELKTAHSARLCLREAVGQLLEYAHYTGRRQTRLLVVVGYAPPTDLDLRYLDFLRREYEIPLAYWRFASDREADALEIFPSDAAIF